MATRRSQTSTWQQINEIVEQTLELPTEEARAAFVDQACDGDETLRIVVEPLVAEDQAAARAYLSALAAMTAGRDNGDGGDDVRPTSRLDEQLAAVWKSGMNLEQEHMLTALSEKLFGVQDTPTRLGRYVILERLGRGGMGVVYSAYDPELERKVALKLLRTRADDPDARARLRREAQALARLSHPNVVHIYDVATINGEVVVVMEFVKGLTLRAWRDRESRDWRQILQQYIAAARGLAAAHHAGITHRDFKPENVLVGDDGRVRVVDFGLARDHAQAAHTAPEPEVGTTSPAGALTRNLTVAGTVLGTPAYMSPEMHQGKPANEASDQFSFCVALFEALYGERPFDGNTLAELMAQKARGLAAADIRPADAKVPSWLHELVVRGLSTEPAERWPSMDGLIAALQDDPETRRRRRRTRVLMAVAVLGVLVGVGWLGQRAASRVDVEREQKHQAQEQRDDVMLRLRAELRRSRDAARMLAVENMKDDATTALSIVREVEDPESTPYWAEKASILLREPVAEVVLQGHSGDIQCVAFSPDGSHVATSSADKTVRIWRADGRGAAIVLAGHTSFVDSVAFSPDGRRVVTASRDNTARVWNTDGTGEPIVLRGHTEEVIAAIFSPDGASVATASHDGTARVWNADGTGTAVVLRGHTARIYAIAFDAAGTRLATASADKTARVWSVDADRAPVTLRGHEDHVYAASFSPDGMRVVTASRDKTARVWSADGSGSPIVLRGHTDVVMTARFAPHGDRVATASIDKSARVWNVDGAGEPVVLRGHSDRVNALAFSPDGDRIITGSADHTARIWNTDGRGATIVLQGHGNIVYTVAFSPDGERAVTGSWDDTVRIWRAPEHANREVLIRHDAAIVWLELSPDGARVVSGSLDNTAQISNVDGSDEPVVLRGHGGSVRHASFSADGRRIVTASSDKTARIWNADGRNADGRNADGRNADGTGIPIVLAGHSDMVMSARFDHGGTRIVTASVDKTVRIWNADGTGEPVVLSGHTANVFSAEFSPDDTRVLTASDDTTARIWRADGSGEPIVLRGHTADLYDAHFSADGRQVVTAAADGTARVWRADVESAPRVLEGHGGTVTCARFSPDSTRVVTCSVDRTARIWNLEATDSPAVLEGHQDTVQSATFSADGAGVLTISIDKIARVWRADGVGHPSVLRGHTRALTAGIFSHDGRHAITAAGDGVVYLWRDAWPKASLERALWRATDYCVPAALRQSLLGTSEASAHAEWSRCSAMISERQ